jgi:hypothetical protein
VRRAVAVGFCALLTIGATAQPAAAFGLSAHEQITREALNDIVHEEALDQIVGRYFFGFPGGNLGSDRFQDDYARHQDSAPNAEAICDRWVRGQNRFLNEAVRLAAPGSDPLRKTMPQREAALGRLGESFHALQDFYSHSNWVDIALQSNRRPDVAPIGSTCDPAQLNRAASGLQTGYYKPLWANGGPLWGCPLGRPPPEPFRYCHAHLAKDFSLLGHGADLVRVDGSLMTYHEEAARVATQATLELWFIFRARFLAAYTPRSWDVDGECLFTKLLNGDATSCLDLTGSWEWEGYATIALHQQGQSVVGLYTPPLLCPRGVELTGYLTGAFSNESLVGDVAECSNDTAVKCGFEPSFTSPFTAILVHTGLSKGIHLTFRVEVFTVWTDTSTGAIVRCDITGKTEDFTSVLVRSLGG